MKYSDYIICDLDGTVADLNHRRHFLSTHPQNWDAFKVGVPLDTPIEQTKKVLYGLDMMQLKIVYLSARDDGQYDTSAKWLYDHHFPQTSEEKLELHMRKEGDMRKDCIVKEEILDNVLIPKFGKLPFAAFDDRKQVVDMWIRRGIFVFDVGQGEGDF